jgi:hypothetical protein
MEPTITEMQKTIDDLVKANAELSAWKQEHSSQKQSFMRMSSRLRKLCKKLAPSSEIVLEMQQLATDIKGLVKEATK